MGPDAFDASRCDNVTADLLPARLELSDGRVCEFRALVEDDAEALLEFLPRMHGETDFVNYLPGEFDWTVEQEREFLRKRIEHPLAISIAAEVDGRIVGVGGAAAPDFRRMQHHAEVGLAVLKEFWHQGIGRRLMELPMEWGRRVGLHKMYLRVYDYNTRAREMYRELGFVEEAALREDIRRADGTFGNTIVMSLVYEKS
jgi:RimJ/RimL family protein N-acetyltransferase